jgi:hypothetical protein
MKLKKKKPNVLRFVDQRYINKNSKSRHRNIVITRAVLEEWLGEAIVSPEIFKGVVNFLL